VAGSGREVSFSVYRPIRINIPAAMARIARMVPNPAMAGTKVTRPVRISQMPSNNIPIFLVKFILVSFLDKAAQIFFIKRTNFSS
jgi:hypothetical protein